MKTTDYTMESDILKKKKKKGDILYVFESFIMSIVFVTKISSWYVFISKRVIILESENVFNKKSFLNEIGRNFGNPQFCFFEIFLVKNTGKSLPKKKPSKIAEMTHFLVLKSYKMA